MPHARSSEFHDAALVIHRKHMRVVKAPPGTSLRAVALEWEARGKTIREFPMLGWQVALEAGESQPLIVSKPADCLRCQEKAQAAAKPETYHAGEPLPGGRTAILSLIETRQAPDLSLAGELRERAE